MVSSSWWHGQCPYTLRYLPNEHYFIFSCFNIFFIAHFMKWSY
jgi:hypothetical protein